MRKNWFLSCLLSLTLICSLANAVWAEDRSLEPGAVGHEVLDGDDWQSIAELYGVRAEKLRGLNTDLTLTKGVVVWVPPSREWPRHKVISGQTLWRISKGYNIPIAELRQANQFSDNSLLPGQKLILPRAQMPNWSLPDKVAKPTFRPKPLGENHSSDRRHQSMGSRSGSFRVTRPDKEEDWIQVHLSDGSQAWVEKQELVLGASAPERPEEVVRRAREFVGVPYKWGGTDPNGYDCSGFVQHVFALSGHTLPRLADVQYEKLEKVEKTSLIVGDLVFFNTDGSGVSHVGLYVGGGAFIHASSSRGVMESRLDQNYYASRYVGGARLQTLSGEQKKPPSRFEDD